MTRTLRSTVAPAGRAATFVAAGAGVPPVTGSGPVGSVGVSGPGRNCTVSVCPVPVEPVVGTAAPVAPNAGVAAAASRPLATAGWRSAASGAPARTSRSHPSPITPSERRNLESRRSPRRALPPLNVTDPALSVTSTAFGRGYPRPAKCSADLDGLVHAPFLVRVHRAPQLVGPALQRHAEPGGGTVLHRLRHHLRSN